jgi:hypothetical protein
MNAKVVPLGPLLQTTKDAVVLFGHSMSDAVSLEGLFPGMTHRQSASVPNLH